MTRSRARIPVANARHWTAIAICAAAAFTGCAPRGGPGIEILPGRDGLRIRTRSPVAVATTDGEILPGVTVPGGMWVPVSFRPLREYRIRLPRGELEYRTPETPGAVPVACLPLGRAPASGPGFSDESVLRFSSDGATLAAGAADGTVQLLTVPALRRIWKIRIAEGAPKAIEFDASGARLVVAEQSPRARVAAFNTRKGRRLWSLDLADQLGSHASSGASSAYARFSLPTALRIARAAQGTVVLNGVHGWTDSTGARRNRSCLYCIRVKDGAIAWTFPADDVLPVNIAWFDVSPDGQRVAAAVSGYGVDPPPEGFPHAPGTVLLIDALDGGLLDAHALLPAEGEAHAPTLWRGIAFSAQGTEVMTGWLDGRLVVFDTGAGRDTLAQARTVPVGSAVSVGDLSVCAPISAVQPFGAHFAAVAALARVPGARGIPPGALHPNQNTLFILAADGSVRTRWQPPSGRIDAIAADPAGRRIAVCIAPAETPGDLAPSGVVLLGGAAGPRPDESPPAFLTLGGNLSLNPDLSPGGEFAAAIETPLLRPDGAGVRGAFRLHLVN